MGEVKLFIVLTIYLDFIIIIISSSHIAHDLPKGRTCGSNDNIQHLNIIYRRHLMGRITLRREMIIKTNIGFELGTIGKNAQVLLTFTGITNRKLTKYQDTPVDRRNQENSRNANCQDILRH